MTEVFELDCRLEELEGNRNLESAADLPAELKKRLAEMDSAIRAEVGDAREITGS